MADSSEGCVLSHSSSRYAGGSTFVAHQRLDMLGVLCISAQDYDSEGRSLGMVEKVPIEMVGGCIRHAQGTVCAYRRDYRCGAFACKQTLVLDGARRTKLPPGGR